MVKKKTQAQNKKILWKLVSRFIRDRDKGVCFTCGATGLSGSNYHCGHFIKASVGGLALYFNEDNLAGQCARCNLWLDGNQYEYGIKLGKKKVAELYKLKQQITKDYPFQEKIDYYTARIKHIKPNEINKE